MPDFSGASLRLTTTGDRETLAILDKIDQKAQAVQKQVIITAKQSAEMWAKANGSVHDFNLQVDALVARQRAAQAQVAQTVATTAAKVESSVFSMSRSTSIGLGELARGIGRVAQSGQVGAMAMREFTGAAFRLSSFAGGELIPVIGLIGYAFVETFEKARREAEKTTATMLGELEKLAHAKDIVGIDVRQQELYSGDPFAQRGSEGHEHETDAQFAGRMGGILGLQAQARALIAKFPALAKPAVLNVSTTGSAYDPFKKERDQLDAINAQLKSQQDELTKLGGIKARLYANEQDMLRAITKSLQEHEHLHAEIADSQLTDLDKILNKERPVVGLLTERKDLIGSLQEKEAALRYELEHGNPTLDHRLQLMRDLTAVQKQLNEEMTTTIGGIKVHPKAAPLPALTNYEASIVDAGKKMQQLLDRIGDELGQTFAHSITAGIEATFANGGNIGKGFDAMTGAILEFVGEMFEEIGASVIAGLGLLKVLKDSIMNMQPEIGIPAALGLIALGAILKSTGSHMVASVAAGGAGGGYGSSATLPAIIDRGYIDPTAHGPATNPAMIAARPAVNLNMTIIGKDDPRAQREIIEMVNAGLRRSTTFQLGKG